MEILHSNPPILHVATPPALELGLFHFANQSPNNIKALFSVYPIL